jgi:hypothetical protein
MGQNYSGGNNAEPAGAALPSVDVRRLGGIFIIEQTSDITTADGDIETLICCPDRGGPFSPTALYGQRLG